MVELINNSKNNNNHNTEFIRISIALYTVLKLWRGMFNVC